jgi:maltose alpha-D-glucosyltransferase/alpha-amylase
MFGQVEFPAIGELPYFVTLGPHSFYWFSLVPQRVEPDGDGVEAPLLSINAGSWDAIFYDGRQAQLERTLPQYLRPRRWFGAKARKIKGVSLTDSIMVPFGEGVAYLAIAAVQYTEGNAETYLLPMAYAEGERAAQLLAEQRHTVVARIKVRSGQEEPGVLYDPLGEREFARALLDLILSRRRLKGASGGELGGHPTRALRAILAATESLEPNLMRGEQSNSSLSFGGNLIMKLFRKVDLGTNPDLEISRFLTEEQAYPNTPPLAGAIEYERPGEEPITLALLQGFVPNEGDAFDYAIDGLSRYFDATLARPDLEAPEAATTIEALLDAPADPPDEAGELVAGYLESARLLGRRTAELHLALAAGTRAAFAPEAFSLLYQRSLYQSMRSLASQTFQGLRKLLPRLPEDVREEATRAAGLEEELLKRFQRISKSKIEATRTRVHGDYHLEQVLFTGRDFMIIDFEGEPVRPISERRIKRSPLRDVAGMLRSYQYAAYSALFGRIGGTTVSPDDAARLRGWADYWAFWVSAAFLRSYLETADGASFVPAARGDLETLLEIYLLEKVIYEVNYEMNNRPSWLGIPITGMLRQLG